MKIKIFLLSVLICGVCHSQKTPSDEVLLGDIGLVLTIDSIEELNQFDLTGIKGLMEDSEENSTIELEIVCNDKIHFGNAKLNNASFKIEGNSNDINGFLRKAKKMKRSIKKFYKNLKTI